MINEKHEKLIKEKIQLIKAFIDNPSAKNAIEVGHSRLCVCWIADYEDVPCTKCIWDIVCKPYRADPYSITDKMLAEMLLDIIKRLAIYEAEHA